MANILIGIIRDETHADMAVDELKSSGFDAGDISVITKERVVNAQGEAAKTRLDHAAEGVLSGSATGGVVGGVAGLLIGIGAIAVPGIGGLLIGGPLAAALGLGGAAAATLSGAVTGAVAGGLVGGLVGLGMPEEQAKVYEQEISQGATVIAVPVNEESDDSAERILIKHGAVDISHLSGGRE